MTTQVSAPPDLSGQIALVTGAARGIGAACATALAHTGADIVLVDIAPCDASRAAVESAGRQAIEVLVDLADRDALRREIARVSDDLGRLDVLVNNAGIVSTTKLAELSDEEWDRVLAVNLTAGLVATQAAWDSLILHQGRVVFIGSRAARTGGNNAGAAYVASKGAVHALVVSVANEGAPHGVRANAVMPGPVETTMTRFPSYQDKSAATPLGRLGAPEDIAQAVVYLASQASSFVTGTVLNVTGGLLPG